MTRLDELQPNVGLIMQLQFDRFAHLRLYARLVGYLSDMTVILTMPTLTTDSFSIIEGDRFVCRGFSRRVAFAFSTRVIKVAGEPFPHLHLAYPKEVETALVRKTLRLPIQQRVSLVKKSESQEIRESATLVDISPHGGSALAPTEFANVSDALILVLPPSQAGGAEISIPVTVRSVRPFKATDATSSQCQYGLQFGDLDADGGRTIDRLIHEQLTSGLA